MKKSFVLILGFALALTAAPFVEKSHAMDKVTLGIAISQTGRYAEPAGRMVNSYKLYVDQVNAGKGWNGKKIDFSILDDKSDKQTSIKLYEKLDHAGQGEPDHRPLLQRHHRRRGQRTRKVQVPHDGAGRLLGHYLEERSQVSIQHYRCRPGLPERRDSPSPRKSASRESPLSARTASSRASRRKAPWTGRRSSASRWF